MRPSLTLCSVLLAACGASDAPRAAPTPTAARQAPNAEPAPDPGRAAAPPSLEALPSLPDGRDGLSAPLREAWLLLEATEPLPASPESVTREGVSQWLAFAVGPWMARRQQRLTSVDALLDAAEALGEGDAVMARALRGLAHEQAWAAVQRAGEALPGADDGVVESMMGLLFAGRVGHSLSWLDRALEGYEGCTRLTPGASTLAHWGPFCEARAERLRRRAEPEAEPGQAVGAIPPPCPRHGDAAHGEGGASDDAVDAPVRVALFVDPERSPLRDRDLGRLRRRVAEELEGRWPGLEWVPPRTLERIEARWRRDRGNGGRCAAQPTFEAFAREALGEVHAVPMIARCDGPPAESTVRCRVGVPLFRIPGARSEEAPSPLGAVVEGDPTRLRAWLEAASRMEPLTDDISFSALGISMVATPIDATPVGAWNEVTSPLPEDADNALLSCAEHGIPARSISAVLQVRSDGHVQRVEVRAHPDRAPADTPAARCVITVLRGVRFASAEGNRQLVVEVALDDTARKSVLACGQRSDAQRLAFHPGFDASLGPVDTCFRDAFGPRASGSVWVSTRVGTDGRVEAAEVWPISLPVAEDGTPRRADGFVGCTERALAAAGFPCLDEPAEVSTEIRFEAREAEAQTGSPAAAPGR